MPRAPTPPVCSRRATRCCWSPFSTAPRCRCSALSTAQPWCRCCRRRTSSASATATPDPIPAAWALMRRCRGFPTTSTARSSARSSNPLRPNLLRVEARSADCCTPGSPSPRTDPRWSNSIVASAIRRPRPCWLYWTRRSGSCCYAAGTGTLADFGELRWRDGAAVTVVLAAENYPGRPRVGDVIVGSEADGVLHAGTARRDDGAIVSSGGRVLSVVGTGADLSAARSQRIRHSEFNSIARQPFPSDIALSAAEGRSASRTRRPDRPDADRWPRDTRRPSPDRLAASERL